LKHQLIMKFNLLTACAILATLSRATADVTVIPRPAKIVEHPGSLVLGEDVSILAPSSLANEARYLTEMLAPATGWHLRGVQTQEAVITLGLDPTLADLGDEGYRLRVTPQGALIEAAKPAGVFYGIQTLRQLLPPQIDSPQPVAGVTWSLPCVEIRDVPRFAWRGFMLDSCRHFQSVATIKEVLEQIARQKLNRFHWHLTEDEAWRIEVPEHPELTDKGAWRAGVDDGKAVGRYGGFYSARDIREIVEFARGRHVLVYPEIEMPGHSTAAIYSCPQFGCDGKPVVPGAPGDLGIGSFAANGRRAFCPSRAETYPFLEDVTLKVSEMFGTPYVHIGADEVPREQWDKCARCRTFIKEQNLKDDIDLQLYFSRRMTSFLTGKGKRPIYWGVDLERGIPEGTIVQGWHPGESSTAAKKGFATINSDCRGVYFDFPQGHGDTGDGSPFLGMLSLKTVYQFDPMPAGLTPEQQRLVLGSEAALWTEYVPEHKLMSKIFPRLFAFAEVVWSPAQADGFEAFQHRMATQLRRLEVMTVPYFGRQEGGVGSSLQERTDKPPRAPEPAAAGATAGGAAFAAQPFRVDPSYLRRHDVVYQAPMQLECEGFPLGNGGMGGLIWTHDNGVELQINKNDVWSGPEEGAGAPDSLAVPRHCARVKVDFGMPVFSWTHLVNDFEGRFSLANGEASFRARTGFATTQVRSWLPQERNVWVIECDNTWAERFVADAKSVARVTVERLGSRAFGGWYSGGFPRDPASGLGSTTTAVQAADLILEEAGDGMRFAVACRILGGKNRPLRLNNHAVEGCTDSPRFTVLVSVATRDDNANPRQAAVALLDRAERDTVEKMRAAKDEWFARFWAQSFVKLGNDYLENIYYLRRYLMGVGSRGKYPVVFNGGLWRWNRDVVNWITPHHWNTQQQYWGLCVQDDCDLMRPYLETYTRMAAEPGMANLAARRGATNDAILLAEMHRFDGTMVDPDRGDMRNALTQAAQVASRFWEYEQYTGDREFLETKAYPFMKRAANFYLQKLAWDAKNSVFTLRASIYEDGGGHGAALNPQSDRNCIEALFTSCIEAAHILGRDRDLTARWQNVLDHLWPRRLVHEDGIDGEVIAPCDEPGKYSVKGWAIGGAVAFPAEIIGIDQKDTPLGKAVMNYIRSLKGYMYSHHPTPVIAARMGDGDEALRLLTDGITEMQYFPQGLMFNCRGYPSNPYDLNLKVNLIGGLGRPTIKWRDFFQCGMEPMSICGTAMNEMMLQSNEGKIRVFPAIPGEWKDSLLAFKLLARGGFLVAAERQNGKSLPVSVRSLRGNVCRLQNPWAGQTATVYQYGGNQPLEFKNEPGDVIAFATRQNQEYILCQGNDLPRVVPTVFASSLNKAPKGLGVSRKLGIGKGFEAGEDAK
jgi:N-acetyl-beta-hexosaminidase